MTDKSIVRELLNVLSLEDSVIDFEIISEKLLSAGYDLRIERVESKKDFTDHLKNNMYDIILADFNLPEFDAFAALRICNDICPEVPFICVSGFIGEILAIELLKLGACDYVLKDRLERLPFAVNRAIQDTMEKSLRRKAEIELQESEKRLRDIIFSTADWIWEVDENGRYIYSSDTSFNLIGKSPEKIIGKSPFDFMPPEEAERVSAIFSEIISNKSPIVDLENWNYDKDGKLVCLLTNGVPVLDTEGRLKGYRGVDKNITERKLSEETIRLSESELNFAQTIARMGSWDLNLVTNKIKLSRNMHSLIMDRTYEREIPFNFFFRKIHPQDKFLIKFHWQEIFDSKKGVSFDLRYIVKEGETMWFQNNLEPTFEGDKVTRIHGVSIDITEKKKVEIELTKAKIKAEAGNRMKTAFMNNISHEIRTPLNGILGFASLLVDPNYDLDEKTKFVNSLNVSVDRLLKTISDYMDISLIASGNIDISNTNIYISGLILEIQGLFTSKCHDRNLELVIECKEDIQVQKIYTDKVLLMKSLTHLLDNALKFTKAGTISFVVHSKDGVFEFSVKDTGVGIKKESHETIFRHFVQEDESDTRSQDGNGLGLAIVKGYAALLGGSISVESDLGYGSIFTLSIPVKVNLSHPVYEVSLPIHNNFGYKPLILIAEDDDTNYNGLKIMLKSSFEIIRATDGLEAVEICRNVKSIKMIFMDIKLPFMNGYEATRLIRQFNDEVIIVANTAYANLSEKSKALEAGCNDYITKPINKQKITDLIKIYLN